jgi:hypothetical protein
VVLAASTLAAADHPVGAWSCIRHVLPRTLPRFQGSCWSTAETPILGDGRRGLLVGYSRIVPPVFLIGYRMAAGPVIPGPAVPRRWIAGFRGVMKPSFHDANSHLKVLLLFRYLVDDEVLLSHRACTNLLPLKNVNSGADAQALDF